MTNEMLIAGKKRTARIDQVLDAAQSCFVDYGFHGAGMAKIAKRAGMSVGHIYHYFENKEAIIAAFVDREGEESAKRFAELEAIPKEQLADHMAERADEMLIHKTDAFQSVLNLEILAECQRNPAIAEIVRRHDERVRALMTRITRDKLGLPDADARTDMMLALFSGLGTRILRNPGLDCAAVVPLLKQAMHLLLEPSPGTTAK